MGERELLRWIRRRIGRRNGRILVDSGHDAAVVRFGRAQVLFKTDSVVDGVHFLSASARPEEIGHKAVARGLSDIAAMGCAPTFAVAAMMIPSGAREPWIKRVMSGMERTASRYGVAIVGGDLTGHRGPLAINVCVLGEPRGRPPVSRRGARPGDALAVSGPLGGSILGKHLRFAPRVREGLELNRRFTLRAMIDISDGLAVDLGHLCDESGVGAVLYERRIPVSAAARALGRRDGRSPLDHALADGEDYELLFAVPADEAARVERSGLGTVIGMATRRRGLRLARKGGQTEPLAPRGWEYGFRP
jgi:thiamine-monophosphate kinase